MAMATMYMDTSVFPIFVDEKYQDYDGIIPIPAIFKYPERCSPLWNCYASKKEWRQYMGAGKTCKPELHDSIIIKRKKRKN